MSRWDTATLVSQVGLIARRVYDQFARVSVKSIMDSRELVLDAMRLQTRDVKCRFRQLPMSGTDIFGGQFDSQLQMEVKRRKDMQKANLSAPRFQSSSRWRGRSNQSQPRRQPSWSGSFSRRPPQSGPRQQRQPQRSFGRLSRGSSRGASTGRGHGFRRP